MLAASQMVDGRNIDTDDDPGRPNITSNKLTENDNSRQWTLQKERLEISRFAILASSQKEESVTNLSG